MERPKTNTDLATMDMKIATIAVHLPPRYRVERQVSSPSVSRRQRGESVIRPLKGKTSQEHVKEYEEASRRMNG